MTDAVRLLKGSREGEKTIEWEDYDNAEYYVGKIGPARFEINSGVGGMFGATRGYPSLRLFYPRNRFIVRGGREPAAPGSGSSGAIKDDRIRPGRKRLARRVLPAIKANGAADTLKELVLFARRKMDVTTHAPGRVQFL